MKLSCMKFLYALVLSAVSAAPAPEVHTNIYCERLGFDQFECPFPYPYKILADYCDEFPKNGKPKQCTPSNIQKYKFKKREDIVIKGKVYEYNACCQPDDILEDSRLCPYPYPYMTQEAYDSAKGKPKKRTRPMTQTCYTPRIDKPKGWKRLLRSNK